MFHTGVSEDVLLKQDEFKALRTRLLNGARDFYRKLEGLLRDRTDRDSRRALARAYKDVGRISADIDSMEEALEVQRRAAVLFEALAREAPDDEARAGLARCAESLAVTLATTGRVAESIAATGRARDLYRALAEADPSDRRRRGDWARAESVYGDTIWLEQRRWPVRTLKAKGGEAQTPAMMAKLADHVWTLAEWIKRPAVQLV